MVSVIQTNSQQDKCCSKILKPLDLCSDNQNVIENGIMVCSHVHGNPSIAEEKQVQEETFVQTKSRRKNEMIRWTSVNELTLSFLKLGIYPKASNSLDEFLSPSIRIASKSQMKKCLTCRKRKKKLYSNQSSPLMCSEIEHLKKNFEDHPTCALDLSKTISPQRLQDNFGEPLSPAVEKYAKIIHSFHTEDETSTTAGIEKDETDNFLQGKIFVKSPTKEYFLSIEVPSQSCSMSPMSPYSPPYSDGNKDFSSRVADMSLVRKNIFEDKCELCHKSILRKSESSCQQPKTSKSQKSSCSQTINPVAKLILSPVVSITRLATSDLDKWKFDREPRRKRIISNHIVTKDCLVILKKLDENVFNEHYKHYKARKRTTKYINSPTPIEKTFRMVTRSQVFRV